MDMYAVSDSTDTVRSLSPTLILNQFFDMIFGAQKGWAYTATKEPQEDGRGSWEKHFFKFPEQKDEMVIFIIESSATKEVYYSPALYKNDRSTRWGDDGKQIPNPIERSDFLGTYFVWADFDNGLPNEEQLSKIPEPTMKIRSSVNRKQHWYWHLNFFETNPDALEKITRALTYHLGADLSGWDYQQVLRPPGTIHHKSGKQVTILTQTSDRKVSIEAFMDIPEVPDHVWDVDVNEEEISPVLEVLLGYAIVNPENRKLILKKSQPVGVRSTALTKVGYVCAEVGMNNTEIYSVLLSCDNRWQKFAPRGPEVQKKQLISIIRYVRKKYPLNIKDNPDEELPYFTFGEFSQMDIRVEWIVEGLIQKNGTPVITGLAGSFKTHMTFNLACHMVAGKNFLHWQFSRPMKLCIVSNELAPAETKEELEKIVATFTPEEQAVIAKNLHVIPLGSRLALNNKKEQDKLLRRLEAYKPEGLFFDSLGQSVDSSPNADEVINDVFEFAKSRINQNYDAFSWFIHHMRKEQIGNRKPRTMSDIYGSAYIANNASLILNLWKGNPSDTVVEVDYLKVRFAKVPASFKMQRIDPAGLQIVSNAYVDLSVGSSKTDDDDFGAIDF